MGKINTHFLVTIYLLYILFNSSVASTCTSQDEQNCEEEKINKYSMEANTKYQKYLQLIKEAKESYKPCNETKCRCHAQVIANDLQVFKKNGISKKLIENVKSKGTKYQIIVNKLYRDKSCMFPARCAGIEHFIFDLLPKLPNMEFIVNTRDWPQIHKQYGIFGPIFSFSKSPDYHDIMYPAWSFWEGGPAISLYPRGIGRWDSHRKKLGKLGNETSWNEKIPKAFFRGSRTSAERDPLVLLSREKPELVNAQYTKNQAWKSDADTLHVPPAKEVSFEEHCKYKYLFNFRGVAASFRFKHILLCKSLVFHVGNEWLEFFYPALKPWIHYIPVEANASKQKLEELIEFTVHHDDIAREIAENGYNLIWNNLRMKDVSCYWSKLLKRYAKLLTYEPVLDATLIEIKKKY
ncbi:O-glucosyltransferase rumi homolog [Anoplophora glabripennis]|uniref:O-glucosyltransferase rumi homolog n=1 Tax=Anoplophora glabripennis TaxID=217634 RepID=UPI000875A03C|nr:O-glucosyltransferase rumi homolog [Anoplophora glabripennis]